MDARAKFYRKGRQMKLARLELVARLYKQGYTIRAIVDEVKRKLGVEKLSTFTIHNDIQKLLAEWQNDRIENTDHLVSLELQRIDDAVRELWDQWEKSKQDYKRTSSKQKGRIDGTKETGEISNNVKTTELEKQEQHIVRIGDPSFISEIRAQLVERRKLLGLYAPEKREITGKNGSPVIEKNKYDLSDLNTEEKLALVTILQKVGGD